MAADQREPLQHQSYSSEGQGDRMGLLETVLKATRQKLVFEPVDFVFGLAGYEIRKVKKQAVPSVDFTPDLSPEYLDGQADSFREGQHPWVQVAARFGLRTGATTGRRDQSMLVRIEQLADVLAYVFWLARRMRTELRVYTLGGAIDLHIDESLLADRETLKTLYSSLYGKPDFAVEFVGAVEGNFTGHLFLYEEDENGLYVVRSQQAYVKKSLPAAFKRIYPKVLDEAGQWSFATPRPVDVVYTWVTKDDPGWVALWNATFPDNPVDADRYASKDELRYSLRALCKYMPWFNHVYIVSNCAQPDYLKDHPRLTWVDHRAIFPDSADLPTFNSHSIEACLHRIPGLSENFIYFNDDMFVFSPCYYGDFFDVAERSVAQLEPYGMVYAENVFDDTREFLAPAIKSQGLLASIFPASRATRLHKHTPYALKKGVLQEIEERFPAALATTRAARKRTPEDINLTSFFYHHYALASGQAVEGDSSYLIVRPTNIQKLVAAGGVRGFKYLCFNDGDGSANDPDYLANYQLLLVKELPDKSWFE